MKKISITSRGTTEEGAALLLVPESAGLEKGWSGTRGRILYAPAARSCSEEKWNGARASGLDDPGIQEKTGFARVEKFAKLRETLAALAKNYPEIYTELPDPHDDGYPHAANWSKWVKDAAPQASLKDVSPAVKGRLRCAIKSPGELALIQKALSIPSHRRAPCSHEDDAAGAVRISGGGQDGGDS